MIGHRLDREEAPDPLYADDAELATVPQDRPLVTGRAMQVPGTAPPRKAGPKPAPVELGHLTHHGALLTELRDDGRSVLAEVRAIGWWVRVAVLVGLAVGVAGLVVAVAALVAALVR